MIRAATIILALLITPVLAQQPDPATLQKAVTVIQAQRNQALDAQASAEIRAALLNEEVTKLKARVQELEAQVPKAGTDQKN